MISKTVIRDSRRQKPKDQKMWTLEHTAVVRYIFLQLNRPSQLIPSTEYPTFIAHIRSYNLATRLHLLSNRTICPTSVLIHV